MTRRVVKIVSRILLGLMAVVVVAAVAAVWRLSSGPIPVNFLTPYLEEALADIESGDTVEIGDTVVAWDSDRSDLALVVRNLHAMQASGETRARIERTKVSLTLRGLLRGVVAVKAIAIEGAQLRLVRAADGRFGFTGSGPQAEPEQAPGGGEKAAEVSEPQDVSGAAGPVLRALLAEPDPDQPISYLRRVSFENSKLTIQDELHDATFDIPVRRIQAYHHAKGIDLDLDADLKIEDKITTLHVDALFDEATEKVDLTASFADLTLSAIAAAARLEQLEPLKGIDLPLTGELFLKGGIDGQIDELQVDIAGRPGTVSYPGVLSEPVDVSSFEANGRFDGATGNIAVKEFDFELGSAGVPGPAFAVRADVDSLRKDVPLLRGQVELRNLQATDFEKYWPADTAPGARAWVVKNISAGVVEKATVDAEFTVPEMRFGDAALSRLAADFSVQLPTTQQSGRLETKVAYAPATDQFDVEADFSGVNPSAVPAIAGAARELKGLRIPLSGKAAASIGLDGALRQIRVDVTGEAGMLAYPELFAEGLDIAALKVRGAYDAGPGEATIEEFSVALGKTAETGPVIAITADAKDLWGKGRITAKAALTRLAIGQADRYWPKGAAEGAREWVAENIPKGTVDRATLNLGVQVADGQIDKARVSRVGGEIRYKDLEVHYLRPLEPIVGVTGTAKYDLKAMVFKVEPGAKVTGFTMTGADITIGGLDVGKETMALKVGLEGPAKSLISILNQPRLDLVSGLGLDPTEVKGDLTVSAELAFPLLEDLDLDDMDILSGAKSKRVVLNKKAADHALADLDVLIHHTNIGWREIKVSGRTVVGGGAEDGTKAPASTDQGAGKSDSFDVSFAPSAAGPYTLSVTAGDAGAMLRAMGIADGLEGGDLKITGATEGPRPDSPLHAHLDMKGYRMREASRTARTLSATGSPTSASRAMSGEGLTIDDHQADVTFHDRVVTIESMYFKASSLGGTAKGTVDLNKQELDISGLLVPLDNVSGVLRSVPVIKRLFSERGGLLAFNFRLTGPIEDPATQVETAKSLTPHVVQQLFGGGEDSRSGDGSGGGSSEGNSKSGDGS